MFVDRCFDVFLCFGYPFFEHEICIDLGMDFGLTFDVFWMPNRSHMQSSKPSKTLVFFTMNFDDLTIQKNIIFYDVHDLFRYKFWH